MLKIGASSMKELFTVRQTCRLCNSNKLVLTIPIGMTPVSDKYSSEKYSKAKDPLVPLDVYMCTECSHVQILHVVNPDHLWDSLHFKTSRNPKLIKHYSNYVNEVIQTATKINSKFHLDIGSNDGTLIKLFMEREFRSIGVDCAKQIADEANLNGFKTIISYMNKKTAEYIHECYGLVDIITANNVYAHIDDMNSLTNSIRYLLSENGLFIFEVSYLADVVNKKLLGTFFHEHLSYHSIKPLSLFLKDHKLEIIKVLKNELEGGSVVCYVQHQNGPYKIEDSVNEIIEEENMLQLDNINTIKNFNNDLQKYKIEINRILDGLLSSGKKIAGFGSGISATTFINYFDIAKKIEFIVDDNEMKHYKFTPQHRIEVLPTKCMYDGKSDYILIFAWQHNNNIIEKHKKYLSNNKGFITLFPKINVIDKHE